MEAAQWLASTPSVVVHLTYTEVFEGTDALNGVEHVGLASMCERAETLVQLRDRGVT